MTVIPSNCTDHDSHGLWRVPGRLDPETLLLHTDADVETIVCFYCIQEQKAENDE